MIRQGLARDVGQRQPCLHSRRRAAGLLARQRQQLLHHVGGTLQSGAQLGKRSGARGRIAGTLAKLQLDLQGSERRAQLVRRVRNEGALHRQCLAEAVEQVVQCAHQRLSFVRHVVGAQGFEGIRATRRHVARKAFQRPQPAANEIPDEGAE